MRETTDNRSSWGHGTFDPLMAALRRDASDKTVRERMANLTRKGIPTAAIVEKVRLTHGPLGANRIQQLCDDPSAVTPQPTRQARRATPYRETRTKRLKRRIAHLAEDFEDALSRLSLRVRSALGSGATGRRRVRRTVGRGPTPGAKGGGRTR